MDPEKVGCSPDRSRKMTLQWIVADYLKNRAPGEAKYLQFYKGQKSVSAAFENAILAKLPSGKRFSHQRRIPEAVLSEAHVRLTNVRAKLLRCRSFSELHAHIEMTIGGIRGVGPLMIYDTAHRLGAYLSLEPQHVYLHAGAREGAKALGLKNFGVRLELSQVPSALRHLRPEQIEDCLCIY